MAKAIYGINLYPVDSLERVFNSYLLDSFTRTSIKKNMGLVQQAPLWRKKQKQNQKIMTASLWSENQRKLNSQ